MGPRFLGNLKILSTIALLDLVIFCRLRDDGDGFNVTKGRLVLAYCWLHRSWHLSCQKGSFAHDLSACTNSSSIYNTESRCLIDRLLAPEEGEKGGQYSFLKILDLGLGKQLGPRSVPFLVQLFQVEGEVGRSKGKL